MTNSSTTDCWFLRHRDAPVFVLLGRTGDSILMCPAFHEIWKRTGLKPRVIVSTDYSDVYDGVSFVQPYPQKLHWYAGIPKAKQIAAALGEGAVVAQWWNDPCPIPPEYRGNFPLQCHGHNHGVNLALWPNFMASMYERCGFTQDEMMRLPLVFDRRNSAREQELLNRLWPLNARKKPLLLFNVTGISSPYGFWPELHAAISPLFRHFHVVDLGKVHAHRIFDLLGLYDEAAGLITVDTATLHLAHASRVSYIAITIDGWTGSRPRGNVALHIKYNETPRRLQEVRAVLERWAHDSSRLEPLPDPGPRDAPTPEDRSGIMARAALVRAAGGRRRVGTAFR